MVDDSSRGGLWDPERDPGRLTDVMRRSGYSADQIRRMMAEVAAAEAEEAERRGLPGLEKLRDTVSRQTVERWAKGQSAPKGWWARIVLIVIERLEETLASGFGVDDGHRAEAVVRYPHFLRWVLPFVFLTVVLGAAFLLSGASEDGEPAGIAPSGGTPAVLFPTGATPVQAPPASDGDPTGPRGAGCDPGPANAWWQPSDGPPLADGIWFGHVLEIEGRDDGGHEMILDLSCFYLSDGGGVRLDSGSPALENDTAMALVLPPGTPVHWPDETGTQVSTGVSEWVDETSGSTGPLPVPCPSGRCAAWVLVNGGLVVEVVVVDFESE